MSSIADALLEEALDRPTIDERRALIDRVAGTAQFRRSARHRDFLLYVGGQSLKPGCPEIHEQESGAKVFGRSASDDRSHDNIVRVNATELRKHSELYVASEGVHETLVPEIPRGGYKPVLRSQLLGWIQRVIAYLPNSSHTGDVVVLAGTDSDATSAAAESLTSEDQLSRLQTSLAFRSFPTLKCCSKYSGSAVLRSTQ
jgi:hypothetical protein